MVGRNSIAWQRLPIISLCEAHVDCVNRTAPVVNEPTPFKMLRTTNVRNGYVDVENVRYVTEETYKKWTRRLVPKRGDIILTREAPLGDVGKIRTDDAVFLGQRLYHFRPNPQKLDADFLLYSLLCEDLQSQIKGFGSGSTVEHMRLEDIPSLEFNVPPLPIQKRIAGILSAYDELIENSQRRIKILESMARALYREWFVHFRFPGHEKIRLVDGLPEGWTRRPLAELAEFRLGKMLDQEKNRGDLLPYLANVNVRWGEFDLNDLREMRFTESELDTYGLRFGDIVMCEGGEPGRCAIWKEQLPGMMIQKAIHRIRCRENMDYHYLYQSLRHLGQSGYLASLFTGATIKHLPREKLAMVTVIVPPTSLLNQFKGVVFSTEGQTLALQRQVQNLRRTRDLLLPRLLSGQIEVQDIDA